KLADLLREEGKEEAALEAYARATAVFLASVGAEPRPPAGGIAMGFRGRAAKGQEGPVDRALRWLAAHQEPDTGGWDADGFMKHDPKEDRCDGKGAADADVLVTGLATLAFLGAGHTGREGAYAGNVRSALACLVAAQKEDGGFGGASLRADAVAAVALSEAYALTRDPFLMKPAERGVAALVRQQAGGWKDDAALTAWCASAIASARGAGLDVPERSLADALAWVQASTDRASGRVGKEGKTERSTAAALFTCILCQQAGLAVEAIPGGFALCVAKPPAWNVEEGTIDMEYWRFGTLALYRAGDDDWRAWTRAMKAAIVDRQQTAGSRAGSWDPVGVEGGRVEATALLTMSLEVYYRYADAMGVR
ncbi:MAG: hypothetical protein L6Q95_19235, partial [Planctomycetes bacterium]|nr:hypothetical protein [Planctomycetota bacterium]